MALPSSGSLSLSQIRQEFGSDGATSLSDYYRYSSGNLVAATSVNSSVPTAAPISISSFYSAAEFMGYETTDGIALTASDFPIGGTAIAEFLISANGQLDYTVSGSFVSSSGPDYWGTPLTSSAGNIYQIRLVLDSSTGWSGFGGTAIIFGVNGPFFNGYDSGWVDANVVRSIYGDAFGGTGYQSVVMNGILYFRKKYATGTVISQSFSLSVDSGF